MNRWLRFTGLPRAERHALIEAALGLIGASTRLRVVPFRKIASGLGQQMVESGTEDDPATKAEAERVRWAVETAAQALPWRPMCMPQAVAATVLLRRRGIRSTFYLGLDPAHDLEAHAWVRVGSVIVTGGPHHTRFTVVSTFA